MREAIGGAASAAASAQAHAPWKALPVAVTRKLVSTRYTETQCKAKRLSQWHISQFKHEFQQKSSDRIDFACGKQQAWRESAARGAGGRRRRRRQRPRARCARLRQVDGRGPLLKRRHVPPATQSHWCELSCSRCHCNSWSAEIQVLILSHTSSY